MSGLPVPAMIGSQQPPNAPQGPHNQGGGEPVLSGGEYPGVGLPKVTPEEQELLAEKAAIELESQSICEELAAIDNEKAFIEQLKQTNPGDPQIHIRELNLENWRSANGNRGFVIEKRRFVNEGNFKILRKRQGRVAAKAKEALQNAQPSNANIQQQLQNLQVHTTAPNQSGSPVPAMIGPQQPPTVPAGRHKPFRTLAQGGLFGKKEAMAEMPIHMIQGFEAEHAAIIAEGQAIAAVGDTHKAEKAAIEQLRLSNPGDPQLPTLNANLKQRVLDLVQRQQKLNGRKSQLKGQIQKMRKDQAKAAAKQLYAQAEAELSQMQIENKQMYGFTPAPAQMGNSNVRMQPQYQSAPMRITHFLNTQQNMRMQSDPPTQSSNAYIQQPWGNQNGVHMQPPTQPQNTGAAGKPGAFPRSVGMIWKRGEAAAWKQQQVAGKIALQQHKQELALQQQNENEVALEIQRQKEISLEFEKQKESESLADWQPTLEPLDPDRLTSRYGPGPYVGKGFDSPKLTRDLSSILTPVKLLQRDRRRQALDKIMNTPLGPLPRRRERAENNFRPINAVTPIHISAYYPNNPAQQTPTPNPPFHQIQPTSYNESAREGQPGTAMGDSAFTARADVVKKRQQELADAVMAQDGKVAELISAAQRQGQAEDQADTMMGAMMDGASDVPDRVPNANATDAFKVLATRERSVVEKPGMTKATNDKGIKLSDLKKFADSFKLHTPVPSDIIPLIAKQTAKDPAKEKDIQEKAKRNAEESKAWGIAEENTSTTQPEVQAQPDSTMGGL